MPEHNFEEVERPSVVRSGRHLFKITLAVINTINTGKAIRIDCTQSGKSVKSLTNHIYVLAKRKNLICHSKKDGNFVTIWMEKKNNDSDSKESKLGNK